MSQRLTYGRVKDLAGPLGLLVLYALIYGVLLYVTRGMPYVMDNNESFSSLWHAGNLYKYPLSDSLGLTDESYGTSALSHPYVYTHQGNFPRLFAYAIYVLGARTIESQIVVTTFTVGVIATLMAYKFFARISCALLALLCCFVFMTDYLLIGQWQVVTYRVWHEFFVFSSLLSVLAVSNSGRTSRALIIGNFACLFYFEFVFVAFVTASSLLFALYIHWRRSRRLVEFLFLLAIGASVAIAALATQLIAYLGWSDFVRDAYFTVVARNRFLHDPLLLQKMGEFFDSRNIVFWYNLEDGAKFRTLPYFLASFFYYEFQVHTPFFSLLIFIVTVGLGIGYVLPWLRASQTVDSKNTEANLALAITLALLHVVHMFLSGRPGGMLLMLPALAASCAALSYILTARGVKSRFIPDARTLLYVALWLVVPSMVTYESSSGVLIFGRYSALYATFIGVYIGVLVMGLYGRSKPVFALGTYTRELQARAVSGIVFAILALCFFVIWRGWLTERLIGVDGGAIFPARLSDMIGPCLFVAAAAVSGVLLPPSMVMQLGGDPVDARGQRLIALTVFIVIVTGLVAMGPRLYHQIYITLWRTVLSAFPLEHTEIAMLAAAMFVGGALIVFGQTAFSPGERQGLNTMLAFLLTGFAAYALAFVIFPAYMFTGYRFRLTPFTAFHTDTLIAIAAFAAIRISALAARRLQLQAKPIAASRTFLRRIGFDGACLAMSVAFIGGLVMYWATMQAVHLAIFPPYYSLFFKLKEYRGASTITNTYGAPLAWATQNWSYLYPQIVGRNMPRDGERYVLTPDVTYMWFADKYKNVAYRRPAYYVCVAGIALPLTVRVMNRRLGIQDERYGGCDDDFLVQRSIAKADDVCPPVELAEIDNQGRDDTGYPRWAIVRLNWEKADARCKNFVDQYPLKPKPQ